MERLKSTTIIFLLTVGLLTSAAPAKSASVLLQEGLYAEEIEGDLDAAIKIYEQVIAGAKEAQRVAAQATYRIGMCYLKKGQKDKAAEHFQNIILNFPSQKALVTKAEKQLDKIKPRAERIVEQTVMTISTCSEGDPKVAQALESLKGLDESAVVSELVKFLDSETDTVRRSTIYILWRGNLSDISAAVPVLEKLCSHEEELTRGMAALALGQAKVNSSFDTLCDMTLKDNSGYARRCGAIALGWMGRADARPILEKALEDPDPLVGNNAKAALVMLPEKVRPPTMVFEPQALIEQIKAGKVPSFKVQLHDNTGLDLDNGEIAPLKDEWPDRFDVAWDNDEGGVLMKKAGAGVRFLDLPSGEKQRWDKAIYMARSDIDELRNSNTRSIWAGRSKFSAVLTSEGNLAVIQIGEYDANKGTIYGWVEKIPAAGFGPVNEQVMHQPESNKDCMIDFESGRLFAFPENLKDLPMDDNGVQSWLEQNGIDAIAAVKGKLGGLEGVRGLRAVSMRDLGWDALPDKLVATIEREIALHPTPDKARMFALGGIPFDFFFKTSDGGIGVLQLLEIHSPHIGTRIRYKMLQVETAQLRVSSHKVFLPECDTTVYDLLDLASSRIINSEPGGKLIDLRDPAGKGNLYFDRSRGSDYLACVRGTRMQLRNGSELLSSEPNFISHGRNAYYPIVEIPSQYLVTTAQGDKYELKVLSVMTSDRPGVHIEYWKSADSPGGLDVATPVRGDAAKAMELLSGLKALMAGVVGAVESDDPNMGLLLLDKLIAQSKQFKSTVKDTSVEAAVKAGIEMLEPLRDALEKKQMGRVKSLLAALNQMGPAVESALEKEAEQQGQSKKKTSIDEKLRSAFIACGTLCDSIREALDNDDFESAETLCKEVEKHIEKGLELTPQTELGPMLESLAGQFKVWHEAIKVKDKKKAIRLGEALNRAGGLISNFVLEEKPDTQK